MRSTVGKWGRFIICFAPAGILGSVWSAGCAGGSDAYRLLLMPPFTPVATGTQAATGPVSLGAGGGFFAGEDRAAVDPCSEPLNRKFIRISMRNLAPSEHIHYFLVLVAHVNSDTYPDGAVCPDDVSLYTQFGYDEVPEGAQQEFGNLCIIGPALLYFHESGQFRSGGGAGGADLASAIAPAQGTSATFDRFFTSSGAQVPVPNLIYFHNPGTGEGAALRISNSRPSPCAAVSITTLTDPDCRQDAFYYVDENDLLNGSSRLGTGSARRVPDEVQGTSCECRGFSNPAQQLAPSRVTAANARCDEFVRGGRIEYAFLREDTEPPFPQLLWKVTDQAGAVVHEFDSRGNIR